MRLSFCWSIKMMQDSSQAWLICFGPYDSSREKIWAPKAWQEKDDIPNFFIYYLLHDLRVHLKSGSVSLLNNSGFHFRCFFKIDNRWADFGNDALNELGINFNNVGQDIIKDLTYVSILSNLFALDISYQHAWVQLIIDNARSSHVHPWRSNFLLIWIAKSWLLQLWKVQHSESTDFSNHW